MASGGNTRNRRTARVFWACLPAVEDVTANLAKTTRGEACRALQDLIRHLTLVGTGPPFFTKVMFFFGCAGAHFLDQRMVKGILALR